MVLPRRASEREAAAAIREFRPWIERRVADQHIAETVAKRVEVAGTHENQVFDSPSGVCRVGQAETYRRFDGINTAAARQALIDHIAGIVDDVHVVTCQPMQ